jgi:hypothetical protein
MGYRRHAASSDGYRFQSRTLRFRFSRRKPVFGAPMRAACFRASAVISRPVERRVAISAKAMITEIERMDVAGRCVLCARRSFDEFGPI